MLPGFRVALATVVLTVSVLVFGLGVAALLRASHDQFASLPPAQAPRERAYARDQEARQVNLAMLRVELAEQQEVVVPPAPPAEVDSHSSDVALAPVAPAPITARQEPGLAPSPADAAEKAAAAPSQDVAVKERPQDISSDPPRPDPDAAPLAAIAAKLGLPAGDVSDRPLDGSSGPVCAPAPAAASWLQLSMLGDPAQAGSSLSLLKRSGSVSASLYWPPGPVVRHRHRPSRPHHARLRRHRLALRPRTLASAQPATPGDPFASFGQSAPVRGR